MDYRKLTEVIEASASQRNKALVAMLHRRLKQCIDDEHEAKYWLYRLAGEAKQEAIRESARS